MQFTWSLGQTASLLSYNLHIVMTCKYNAMSMGFTNDRSAKYLAYLLVERQVYTDEWLDFHFQCGCL